MVFITKDFYGNYQCPFCEDGILSVRGTDILEKTQVGFLCYECFECFIVDKKEVVDFYPIK